MGGGNWRGRELGGVGEVSRELKKEHSFVVLSYFK